MKKKIPPKDKIKINFHTAYVKWDDDEYKIFRPKEYMKAGYDCDTDEPLYDLEDDEFHAIIMKCDDYDILRNSRKLDIEYDDCITVSEKKYDNYMFLFGDFYSFQYERSKIYVLNEEE